MAVFAPINQTSSIRFIQMESQSKSLRSYTALLSLPMLPFLNLMSVERIVGLATANDNVFISQNQVKPKQLTDYFADDPFIEHLDEDNKDVINQWGIHALYELYGLSQAVSRAANLLGQSIEIDFQADLDQITDEEWFQLINQSGFLESLYPQELRLIRSYGFKVFTLKNNMIKSLENQVNGMIRDDNDAQIVRDSLSPATKSEKIDSLVIRFMNNTENFDDLELYREIEGQIVEADQLSPKSIDFLINLSWKLFNDDLVDESLAVAHKLYSLASTKWEKDSLSRLKASNMLLHLLWSEAASENPKSKLKFDYQNQLLVNILDDSINTTESWWGPNSLKLVPLFLNKVKLIESNKNILSDSDLTDIIYLMERAVAILLESKKANYFPTQDSELLADVHMRILTMKLVSFDLAKKNFSGAYQRILRFKSFPFHARSADKSIYFGQLFTEMTSAGEYARLIEMAENLLRLHESDKIKLDDEEIYTISEELAFCYVFVGRFSDFDDLYAILDQDDDVVEGMRLLSLFNQGIIPKIKYPLPSLISRDGIVDEFTVLVYGIAMTIEGANKNYAKSVGIGERLYEAMLSSPSTVGLHDVSHLLSTAYFVSGGKQNGKKYLRKTVEHLKAKSNRSSIDDQISIEELQLNLVDGNIQESHIKALSIFEFWLRHLQTELALMPSEERSQYLQSGIASIQDSQALNLTLSSSSLTSEYPDLPLFYVLNRKGLLEEIEKKQRILVESDQSTQLKVKQIREKQQLIANKNVEGQSLKSLQSEVNSLERDLYRSIPDLKPKLFSVQEVSRALPADGALVEFVRYQWANPINPSNKAEHYAAIVLKPNGQSKVVQIGEIDKIDAQIASSIAATEATLVDSEDLLDKAFNAVLKPLYSELSGIKVLYISPDGELNRLPFDAAKFGRAGQYLSESMNVRMLTTGRELVQLRQPARSSSTNSLVVANPSFDRKHIVDKMDNAPVIRSSSDNVQSSNNFRNSKGLDLIWSPLEYTQEEGRVIAEMVDGLLLTADEATTTKVKSIRSPRVVHFATHGFYIPDEQSSPRDALVTSSFFDRKNIGPVTNPLTRSGIVLAGANQPEMDRGDDGYLSALEVLQLDWSGTELAVVSSCLSGRGSLKRGEGIYGLKRAFAVAGARSSLLSLWEVDDKATAAFMKIFYQRLKEGKGKAEALADTQREFRIHPIAAWRHPYFWAGFQLSGDWGPIKGL